MEQPIVASYSNGFECSSPSSSEQSDLMMTTTMMVMDNNHRTSEVYKQAFQVTSDLVAQEIAMMLEVEENNRVVVDFVEDYKTDDFTNDESSSLEEAFRVANTLNKKQNANKMQLQSIDEHTVDTVIEKDSMDSTDQDKSLLTTQSRRQSLHMVLPLSPVSVAAEDANWS